MSQYADRLRKQDFEVRPVPLRTAQAMVAMNHYAKGGSNTGTFVHGLFRKDDPWTCLGVAKNAAGFLISQSVKMIQAAGGWEKLVTYADTWQGHTDGIYKATNWTFEGMTTRDATFVDKEGRMVARKAGGHTRTRAEMDAIGCQMIGRFSKLRFTMTLKPKKQVEHEPIPETPSLFPEMQP